MHLPPTLRLVRTESTVRHSAGWDTLVRALARGTGLERLGLSGGHTQYESLNDLDLLHHLDLTDVGLSGFELKLPRLQSLSMVAGGLEDFLLIESCQALEIVSVAASSALTSCEGIQTLPHLRSLTISECPALVDVSALVEVASDLTELVIAGCPNVDLTLSGLTDFRYDQSDRGDNDGTDGVEEPGDLEPQDLRKILLNSVPTRLCGHDRLLVDGRELDPVDRTAAEERAKELRRLVDERMTRDEAIELSRLMWLGGR